MFMVKEMIKIAIMTPREAVVSIEKAIDNLVLSVNHIPKEAFNYKKDITIAVSAIHNIQITVDKLRALQKRIREGKH